MTDEPPIILGRFEDPVSMRIASERFVNALTNRPVQVENVEEPRLACGHSSECGHTVDGKVQCRICDRRAKADYSRAQRLPEIIENTRTKLTLLEREAKRRGQIV